MQNKKRILEVKITRDVDDNPDMSWIGEYSDKVKDEFTIDREHDSDCPRFWADADIPDDARECDCSGDRLLRELQYFDGGSLEAFNPESACYKSKDEWRAMMRENALQDYKRAEDYNRQEWCFLGVIARAIVGIPSYGGSYLTQKVTSGGLWGIESDSDASYIREVETSQLSELRHALKEFGFSTRAISAAYKNVKRDS